MLPDQGMAIGCVGLCTTGGAAFLLAWSVHWIRNVGVAQLSGWGIFLISSIAILTSVALYALLRRQWLQYVRSQVIETASAMAFNAQSFDAAAAAAITWIQEVELVSRGYRM